jgi:hypothetical protein
MVQKPSTQPSALPRTFEEGFYLLRREKKWYETKQDKTEVPCVIRRALSEAGTSGIAVFELEEGSYGDDLSRFTPNQFRKMNDDEIVSVRGKFIERYNYLARLSCANNEDVSHEIQELGEVIRNFDSYMCLLGKEHLLPPIKVTLESSGEVLIIPRGHLPL